jgi:hypothetical protein
MSNKDCSCVTALQLADLKPVQLNPENGKPGPAYYAA